jgi:beta-glucosidase
MIKRFLLLTAFVFSQTLMAQKDAKMNLFITNLMNRMTLDEKIGQLNLPSVGFDVTGPILSQNVSENIRKGNVGGVSPLSMYNCF